MAEFFYLSEKRRKKKIKGEQCNLKVVLVYLAAVLHDFVTLTFQNRCYISYVNDKETKV